MDQKILKQLEELQITVAKIAATVVTKEEAKGFATKDDLKQLKAALKQMKIDLIEEIKESEGFIVGSVDKNKADKKDVEELEGRVAKIERKLAL